MITIKVNNIELIILVSLFGLAMVSATLGVGVAFIMDRVDCIKYDDKCYIPFYVAEIALAVIGILFVIWWVIVLGTSIVN